ncbi:MAG: hypothetical protein A2512_09725 [Deltaproteobacteria bacterium RIFOXYD12_FULL_56_24]|nr:MAG: hypothetical protein A2512_09725 [Deltaproteobacteria bacterium RIFOXYD12_FULL_56_24]
MSSSERPADFFSISERGEFIPRNHVMRRMRTGLAALAVAWLVSSVPVGAAETKEGLLGLSVSYTHSSGTYGLENDTRIDLIPLTVDYARGPWFASLSIPSVRLSGFGNVTMGADGPIQINSAAVGAMVGGAGAGTSAPPSGGNGPGSNSSPGSNMGTATTCQQQRSTVSGLGDLSAEAGYGFFTFGDSGVLVEISGRIKFPTADEDKGLGTGKADYSAQAAVSLPAGRFQPFVQLGYTITGDTSLMTLNDVPYGSLGATLILGKYLDATGAYSFRQKITDTADDFHETSLSLEWRMGRGWRTWAAFAAGLSNAAPDWTSGIGLSRSF